MFVLLILITLCRAGVVVGGGAVGNVCCIITILYWLSRDLFITVPLRRDGSYSQTEARKEKFALEKQEPECEDSAIVMFCHLTQPRFY